MQSRNCILQYLDALILPKTEFILIPKSLPRFSKLSSSSEKMNPYLVGWSWGPRLGISVFPIHSSSSTVMLAASPIVERNSKRSNISVTRNIRVWELSASYLGFSSCHICKCKCPINKGTLAPCTMQVSLCWSVLCWHDPPYYFFCWYQPKCTYLL